MLRAEQDLGLLERKEWMVLPEQAGFMERVPAALLQDLAMVAQVEQAFFLCQQVAQVVRVVLLAVLVKPDPRQLLVHWVEVALLAEMVLAGCHAA